ncbi:hypothetical protein F0Q45_21040 [Mycobacterium simiae]|uniref:Uncharacterized protein n=1 Tax=Mycobacterium simiae TaxID=1784 RepID=A0A5B1BJ18_MYCSI|nr:hypothetical protein [Mycobacterium simiae]KAA1248356.1 hypothetical protein F0Q45_21040 [Mycobacterium simiae]
MIDRDVAIKILPTEVANEPGYRERFRREAHVAARLSELLLELRAGSNTQVELPFPAHHTELPVSIAVGAAGSVYVTYGGTSGASRITKLPACSTTAALLCAR